MIRVPSATASHLDSRNDRAALGGLAALLILALLAFRGECWTVYLEASSFSEWSHVWCLPVMIGAYAWLRRDDFRAALGNGSAWGVALLLFSAVWWFAIVSLGLFTYLSLFAPLLAFAGAAWAVCGRAFVRTCIPILLMVATCLPLSERSMERFSLATQRASLYGAVSALNAVPGITASRHGTTIAYSRGAQSGEIGVGEQRFAFRLIPASLMIGLFAVFARPRPTWQIVLLTIVALPLVLLSNVLRIVAASLVAIWGNFSSVSNVPRNISIVAGLLLAWLLFILAMGLLRHVARLGQLFYVEEDSTQPPSPPSGSAAGGAL